MGNPSNQYQSNINNGKSNEPYVQAKSENNNNHNVGNNDNVSSGDTRKI